MKKFSLHIPEGVKDYSGEEAALKDSIQTQVKKIFRTHSYHLVETPSFEYLDVFTMGEESFQQPSLYHLVSRQGELMALRSDMTRSIARVIGIQKGEIKLPQRFCYLANSFRYPERYQGKLHEFTQAGIELIGKDGIQADAEVIKIAITCLKEIGVHDFTVHIGSGEFFKVVLENLGLSEENKEQVLKAIEKKDAVQVKAILKGSRIDAAMLDLLIMLLQCCGPIDLLKKVKAQMVAPQIREVLEQMEKLYDILEDYGVQEYVLFDFSLMSYGQYYTGMMFQIFALGIGSALVEGGRYDHLLAQFGKDLPAVGFGIHINLVLQRLILQRDLKKRQVKPILAISTALTRKTCQEVCDGLRKNGTIIENSLCDTLKESLEYAHNMEIHEVLFFKQENKIDVYHLDKGTVEEKTINEL